jgi:hypothetical protein
MTRFAGHGRKRASCGLTIGGVTRLLCFAVAVFVFQQLPAFAGNAGTWIDLLTPLFVVGAAAWALNGASRIALAVAVVAAIAYVDGHGIHLSANDIGHYDGIAGEAEDVRHFWDEHFSHIEWHLGLLGLLAGLALADKERGWPDRLGWIAALLLGWTLFTNTVEGQDWWLTLSAAVVFTAWALAQRTRTVAACALATILGAALIGAWAAWQGGVVEFGEVGWL